MVRKKLRGVDGVVQFDFADDQDVRIPSVTKCGDLAALSFNTVGVQNSNSNIITRGAGQMAGWWSVWSTGDWRRGPNFRRILWRVGAAMCMGFKNWDRGADTMQENRVIAWDPGERVETTVFLVACKTVPVSGLYSVVLLGVHTYTWLVIPYITVVAADWYSQFTYAAWVHGWVGGRVAFYVTTQ